MCPGARAAQDGAPEVFSAASRLPIQISLSHREDHAVCTLGTSDDAIGCDIERVEARTPAFLDDFLLPEERARVVGPDARAWLVAALLWSAKESCLKALRVGLRRDTRSIEILLPESISLEPRWHPLRALDREGAGFFSGWWRSQDRFVITVLSRGPAPEPLRL